VFKAQGKTKEMPELTWASTGEVGAILYITVNDRIPNRPFFEWSFFGHFLGPVFERSSIQMPGSTLLIRFLNGPKLDHFIKKNFLFMTLFYYKIV
jgi:hypothetical protein